MTAFLQNNKQHYDEMAFAEAPQLVAVLKEMKDGLDTATTKVQALTAEVKAENIRIADGISYLEAKHLLLLNYGQSLVYYLLRKAKGLLIQGHPLVQSLYEIRLYLEKLTRVTATTDEKSGSTVKEADATQKTLDGDGVYLPQKWPLLLWRKIRCQDERKALRKDRENMRQLKQSAYVIELMNYLEGRPEEITETVGPESRELTKYMAKMEERARQEEEHFTHAPLTNSEKMTMKHLKKSRNG
ncbi:Sas10/Utp3/C1D family [Forsythia ovata]|uniref:Sas10/Utp3/C1D family n=1 Tax=Forsythia ovata TaxID=205694 RepID=A0ABD1WI41_9LAMI